MPQRVRVKDDDDASENIVRASGEGEAIQPILGNVELQFEHERAPIYIPSSSLAYLAFQIIL